MRWATSTFKESSCICMLFIWADIRSRVRLNRSCPAETFARLTPGCSHKATSAAKIDSQLALSLELLGGVGGSSDTTMRVRRSGVGGSSDTTLRVVPDIATESRVGTRGGIHKDGKEQT